ncbi:hypothetical protein J4476_00020 [Candidatus Woesearchaeota archaeon]|nr:MAG: hypothetical protein QT09_C0008G0006 [archaeon GW2011_AR18]MBS3161069.1 hypothetical protein [Candidatus Woesearchaeota archaeon]HIH25635.1 hypothetical protein [Nanoarchaeota archaeon]
MKRVLIFLLIILIGCSQPIENNYRENLSSTSTEHPPTDYDKFNEIKKEIDYWHAKGPRQIGKDHYNQILERLNGVTNIPSEELDEYRRRLDSIILAEEPKDPKEKISTQGQPRGNNCENIETIIFTSPPMRIEDIGFIEPIGLMIGGHVTPIDHGYYTSKTWKPGDSREDVNQFVDVLSPAAGIITEIASMPSEYSSSSIGDYRFEIQHSCSFKTIYIHVNQLSDKLQKALQNRESVKVEAGEVIGKAPGFDFSVHDEKITLKGFIVLEHYEAEPWKVHTVDMFDYFEEPIKSQLLDKNIRQKMPRGGKLDYDIDGKLVGSWFERGTNWYEGKKEYKRSIGYWKTHLAFAYDGLDPDLLIVSIGDFKGEAQQFAVKGNAPDFANIDVNNGMIKYELIPWEYIKNNGERWDRTSFAQITGSTPGSKVKGVVLVQVLEERKIKFETFPDKKASEVNEFTDKAKIYER